MTVTVLGGSAAGGNTGAGCSGLLVATDETTIVLDLGPGTLLELRRHTDFRTLDGIIISHLHLDHVLDLPALRFALAYNPVPPPALIHLWMPPGGSAFLDRLANAFADPGKESSFFTSTFAVHEYDPDVALIVGNVTIAFTPTIHYVPCWALRLSARDTKGDFVYTADTGPAAHLERFAAGAAVVAAEATLLETRDEAFETRGHLTAGEAGSLARDAGAETLLLTHLWEELDVELLAAAAAKEFPGRIEVARPGLTVEW